VRKKKITIGLSEQDIDRALREMAQYKTEFLQKVELLREKVADRLAVEAQSGFTGAVVDDLIKRGQKFADVKVSVDNRANLSVVVANGEDAVWVEFGAGVYHNGSPGSSPHPNGAEMGFTIGSFDKGNGKKEAWGYYDENNELKLTRGTPATMPMHRAVQTVCNDIQNIAREVFG